MSLEDKIEKLQAQLIDSINLNTKLERRLTKTNRILRVIILKEGKPDWNTLQKYLGDLK